MVDGLRSFNALFCMAAEDKAKNGLEKSVQICHNFKPCGRDFVWKISPLQDSGRKSRSFCSFPSKAVNF